MVGLLITLLILLLVVVVAFVIIDQLPLPAPYPWICKLVIGVIVLIYVLQMLVPLAGGSHVSLH